MVIKASEQFGMELNDRILTAEYAEVFPQCSEGPLEIDFRGCIIDYPATSILIDAALRTLSTASGSRELIAAYNIHFKQHLFLKWLFFGSKELGLDCGTAGNEAIEQQIITGLRRLGITFRMRIVNWKTGETLEAFAFGT